MYKHKKIEGLPLLPRPHWAAHQAIRGETTSDSVTCHDSGQLALWRPGFFSDFWCLGSGQPEKNHRKRDLMVVSHGISW